LGLFFILRPLRRQLANARRNGNKHFAIRFNQFPVAKLRLNNFYDNTRINHINTLYTF
jgi:hypothetical protein